MGNRPRFFPESKMPLRSNRTLLLFFLLLWICGSIGTAHGDESPHDLIALTTPRLPQTITKISRKSLTEVSFHSGYWHGKNWEHSLIMISPQRRKQPASVRHLPMILFLDNFQNGTYPSNDDIAKFQEIANVTNTSVACLGGIPNEPLFERKEGELMAYSIQRYLETGDLSWPLLVPMVRAVRTAMTLLSNPRIAPHDSFVVVGSSKRGWATYLTAATDTRVRAFSVLAFDFVHFTAQIAAYRQGSAPGKELSLYDQLGLFSTTPSPRLNQLFALLDPFNYKDRLHMPKLLMTGTSDRWWDNSMWKRFVPFFEGRTDVVRLPGVDHNVFDNPLGYQILRAWLLSTMMER
jgi:PhoPQ-activated pathogenicity-related protein